jgi:kinesin family protein C2/C3
LVINIILPRFHNCVIVQVASLKDTIARKDMEIEQLQLLKSKSPNSMTDRNGSNLLRQSTSSTGLSSLPVASQQNQQLSGSVEAEAEDNASDDGCSVGETEYSPAGASETSAERAHKAPSRITRFFLTKNGQPSTSRPKPREVVPKTQGMYISQKYSACWVTSTRYLPKFNNCYENT